MLDAGCIAWQLSCGFLDHTYTFIDDLILHSRSPPPFRHPVWRAECRVQSVAAWHSGLVVLRIAPRKGDTKYVLGILFLHVGNMFSTRGRGSDIIIP